MAASLVVDQTGVRKTQAAVPVTLIVPVRNEQDGILVFLESITRQTVAADEIVIVDGGSTDRTKSIIRDFFADDCRVRLIEDSDAYPGRARNLAIEGALTEWIAMTDAGTEVEPDWLEQLVRRVDPDVDVVIGAYEPILVTFFQECLALAFVAPPKPAGKSYVRGPSTASLLIRKSVWDDLGRFPEQLRACEDLIFFERLQALKDRIAFAPDAVVRWNIPESFAEVFRKFRTYSFHTIKAGLASRWHVAVAKMYTVAVVAACLAAINHWLWLLLPLIGIMWRAHRSISRRRRFLKLSIRVGPTAHLVVAIILLWIDAAAIAGAVDYARAEPQDQYRER